MDSCQVLWDKDRISAERSARLGVGSRVGNQSVAPITYIANQVGHAKVTTTPPYYAHLFPAGERRYIDEMQTARLQAVPTAIDIAPDDVGLTLDDDEEWPRFGPGRTSGAPDGSEAPDLIGGPSRTRTLDPLIKRHLLRLKTWVARHLRVRNPAISRH